MTLFPSTVGVAEVIWTVLAIPALLLSLYNTIGAVHDLRYHWKDDLRLLGWVGVGKAVNVLVMAGLVILSGVAAMRVPEPIRPELRSAGDFIAGCMLALDLLLVGLAATFALERRYVVPHIGLLRDRGPARPRPAATTRPEVQP